MKCGWLGGIAAVALAALLTSSGEGALVVNGRVVALSPAARTEGDVTWVPVLAFCPLIGIDPVGRYGTVSLRWDGGRDELRPQESRDIAGVTFAPVDDLVNRVGGTVRREAGETRIEAPVARLVELSAGVDGLTVRLDGFAPTSVLDLAGVYVVRLSNCRADLAEMSVTFGPADVGRATVIAAEGPACEIRVSFLEVAALAVNARDSGDSYTLLLSPSDTPALVSEAALDAGFSCVEARITLGEATADVACIRVDSWRNRIDIDPILPAGGAGSALLDEMSTTTGAVAAISSRSGSQVGVVVIDGVPHSLESDASPTLCFDALDALVPIRSGFAAAAAVAWGRIPLDGIGRPIGYDELVGYPAGYAGSLVRGFPERFLVVRVRDGLVVSILDEPFVVADPSATLLIASGAARVRLDGLALGDRVDLICETVPERRTVSDALSIEGLLLWGGVPAAFSSTATTWSLAGVDWQGGFFFLSIIGTDALSCNDVAIILGLLPISLRDVAVLELGGTASLELALTDFRAQWGRRDPISAGLGAFFR